MMCWLPLPTSAAARTELAQKDRRLQRGGHAVHARHGKGGVPHPHQAPMAIQNPGPVTPSPTQVTPGHTQVTPGHTRSRPVTPSHSLVLDHHLWRSAEKHQAVRADPPDGPAPSCHPPVSTTL